MEVYHWGEEPERETQRRQSQEYDTRPRESKRSKRNLNPTKGLRIIYLYVCHEIIPSVT